METIYTNARIVTRHEVLEGTLLVRDGVISAVEATAGRPRGGIDLEGDLLLPGLIEMHTDNLEKNIQPRPGVIWPSMMAAAIAHDMQIAGAGITTVFDAIAVGGLRADSLRSQILTESIAAINQGNENGLFRAEHLVHLRCEIADEHMETMLLAHGTGAAVRLISVMDHTPGQRQWSDLGKWRLYHREKKWTDEEAAAILSELVARQKRYAGRHRRLAVEFARKRRLPLASHDDTREEDCLDSARDGITIAEFPTTLSAARSARRHGMAVVMGAPNTIRGGSHSGNVSARELAAAGLLDGLSSDYVPISLLHAAFYLSGELTLPLPKAVALVSANIADMVHLGDRGEIGVGKRADLIRVSLVDGLPIVRRVWRQGRAVA